MVSGPVLLKIKGKSGIFIILGVEKRTKMKQWDEIGRIVVPGALNDTKKIRKASADIFSQILGLNKPEKTLTNLIVLRIVFIWGRAICPVVWIYYIWITGRKKGN